jgi:hypothetical protein
MTATGVASVKADAAEMRARLDQCEASTTPFVQLMERWRMQEETLCSGEGLTKMHDASLFEPREERKRAPPIHAASGGL